jgi:hypothetical protein
LLKVLVEVLLKVLVEVLEEDCEFPKKEVEVEKEELERGVLLGVELERGALFEGKVVVGRVSP